MKPTVLRSLFPLLATVAIGAPPCLDQIDALALAHAVHAPPPDLYERQNCLDLLHEGDIASLLDSDDPRLIGIGIQAADRHRLLSLLFSRPHLADDRRETLPLMVMTSRFPARPVPVTQTVAEYYRNMIDVWMGVYPINSEEVSDLIPPDADPWSYARVWAVHITRASIHKDPKVLQSAIDGLRLRSPSVRTYAVGWILTMESQPKPITPETVNELVRDVSEATFRSMVERDDAAPPDAALRDDDFRRRVLDSVLNIRKPPTQPAPGS